MEEKRGGKFHLKAALEQVHSFRERAVLLSGISIGLTLGRI